jgi:glutamate formiminotransferase / 5-formyltetrahydrofolate cyclo-ligase
LIECVVNVSEGRDMTILRALADACGPSLLDVHADPDHHRSVFTLAGREVRDSQMGARSLARTVARHVSVLGHEGVHPRLGAVDVVPFVPLTTAATEKEAALEAALAFARWWSTAYDVPVFLYGDADPKGRELPQARNTAFRSRPPDFGPPRPHDRLGATAVGVRPPLVAVNCLLATKDVEIARRIAASVREQHGGLPGVRALGFTLEAAGGRAQVSMNLADLERTGIERACRAVRVDARKERTDVIAVELVGLVPRAELERCTDDFLEWAGLGADVTIEARLRSGPRWLPGDEPVAPAAPAD